ncbi:trypsin-like serine peptidase [Actinophytocola gossypii]|uniref:Serine protease n=1 Tax=Actinophytocola gossypii TaxID=2812003 RepID=A0ABT2J3T0_9PSEU|nr:trypsin-like peptidase domain-containing protein [Actinophytocola gossypii]MCT2582326.1 trypsin-like peptidase domain-containing protein [Actinophytocola gossypii]
MRRRISLLSTTVLVVIALQVPEASAASHAGKGPVSTPATPVSTPLTAVGTAPARTASGDRSAGANTGGDGAHLAGSAGSGELKDSEGVQHGVPPDTQTLPAGTPDFSSNTVFGPDGRVRAADSAGYPERAIGVLIIDAPDGSTRGCTGFLYGPNIVATAGHCLYHPSMGGWAESVRIYPGQDDTNSPYGYCWGTEAYSVQGWVNDLDRNYDYGAIKLNCTVGDTTGWFGMHWQTSSYNGTRVAVVGYPQDKQPPFTMWGMFGPIEGSRSNQLLYTIDTDSGQSGGPVYYPGCGAFCAIAVHASGDQYWNYGTRITEAVFNNYLDWRYG